MAYDVGIYVIRIWSFLPAMPKHRRGILRNLNYNISVFQMENKKYTFYLNMGIQYKLY